MHLCPKKIIYRAYVYILTEKGLKLCIYTVLKKKKKKKKKHSLLKRRSAPPSVGLCPYKFTLTPVPKIMRIYSSPNKKNFLSKGAQNRTEPTYKF